MAQSPQRRARRHAPVGPSRTPSVAWLALVLVGLVAAAFEPVRHNGWVPFDDPTYVVDNERVRAGLSLDSVRWAATAIHAHNWHPLTWVSHLVDVELFGDDWGRHHLVSAALHAAAALLLLVWLARASGEPWLAFAAAALFAVHPQRVESVAWLAERKDTLSLVFALLAIALYAGWARAGQRRAWWYAAALAAFACSLLAKPMPVSLPLLLLLLDAWPLGRLARWRELGVRLREKAPFFGLALAVAAFTFVAQARVTKTLVDYPAADRVQNAVLSAALYLEQMAWPVDLAVFYPYDIAQRPVWQVGLAAGLLLLVTALLVWRAWRARSPASALLVGWTWYLVALLPVIGLVQVGLQGRADRYTYLPSIGIACALVWGTARLLPGRAPVVAAVALAVSLALVPLTRAQVRTWRDGESLYRHAARVVPGNAWAHYNLAQVLMRQPAPEPALEQLEEVVRLAPDHADAHRNAGILLEELGRLEEATPSFERAAALRPGDLFTQRDLARHFIVRGDWTGARAVLERSLGLDRGGELDSLLGYVLLRLGDAAAAEPVLRRALAQRPNDAVVHNSLGVLLAQRGELGPAAEHLRRAVALAPDNADASSNLATVERALGARR